jgi:hypothetical protein
MYKQDTNPDLTKCQDSMTNAFFLSNSFENKTEAK